MSDPGRYGRAVEAYPGLPVVTALTTWEFFGIFLRGGRNYLVSGLEAAVPVAISAAATGSRRKPDRPMGMPEAGSIISQEARLEIRRDGPRGGEGIW